jgi:hypothetical protein
MRWRSKACVSDSWVLREDIGGKLGPREGGILLLGTPANAIALFFQYDQRSLNGLQVKTN